MADRLADDVESPWHPEEIPDTDQVFMRVLAPEHVMVVGETLRPKPVAFRNSGEGERCGMSTDWCRFCPDPEHTRQRARQKHRPEEYGVVSLDVGKVRAFRQHDARTKQGVKHDPVWCGEGHDDNNQAHSLVTGPKSKSEKIAPADATEIRNWYVLHSTWVVQPDPKYLPE